MNPVQFKISSVENPDTKVKGMTVFNTEQVNTKKQPMFFGKPLGVQRYDSYKYPVFDKLTTQQLGYFWRIQKKFHYRKIVEIITRFAQNKSISIPLTSSTRLCLTPFKGVDPWDGLYTLLQST